MDGWLSHDADNLGEKIKLARLGCGLTLEELAQRAGCTRGYLSQIENGKNAGVPSREMLAALESALSLCAGALVGLGQWARLEPHIRGKARGAVGGVSLDELYQSGELRRMVTGEERRAAIAPVARETTWANVPLMNVVQAGAATEHVDLGFPAGTSDECVSVPREMGADLDAFACRVVGASMEPEYREGDVVVFSPSRVPTDGRDCFVRLEAGGVTFKRVWFVSRGEAPEDAPRRAPGFAPAKVGSHTHMLLEARNPKFGRQVVEREDVGGLAMATSVVRWV